MITFHFKEKELILILHHCRYSHEDIPHEIDTLQGLTVTVMTLLHILFDHAITFIVIDIACTFIIIIIILSGEVCRGCTEIPCGELTLTTSNHGTTITIIHVQMSLQFLIRPVLPFCALNTLRFAVSVCYTFNYIAKHYNSFLGSGSICAH